ncbi:MAG: hypothetical protein PVH88_03440 [Ignavibacteria bacterium]|jgi:hypothetical protein
MKKLLGGFLVSLAVIVFVFAEGVSNDPITHQSGNYYYAQGYILELDRYNCDVYLYYTADRIEVNCGDHQATYYNKSSLSFHFDTKDPNQKVEIKVYYTANPQPSTVGTWNIELK